ncbi:hypothetical protein DFQ01_12752 [Paenibacillus cellulosilyticus]|uniref:N-terminal domain of peptidoglycan hydrolase CwlO-containing protein n=1 Tax=Paenibacillus cellulosilyticus TaxID=375489 RepID=A0A2V2YM62_9BACL|nr:hypothetical protein [Paenibacillus cellulosilyticus]PWV95448.1 hypothetical protein DFQ01_12752 [Paenibacillus cellulosilyticus]QKS43177.1 hypothetical protein HUB94_01480 [Paenibacillus cellulosilyticus]
MIAWIRRSSIAALVAALLLFETVGNASALTPDDVEIQQLLEKSLSVVEIDKEITRVQQEQTKQKAVLTATQTRIDDQEKKLAEQREETGKVLRSYYMGERDWLLRVLLSFHSLKDWLTLLDYIDIIFSRDRTLMTQYTEQARSLRHEYEEQSEQQRKLQQVEEDLLKQRDRVAQLQKEMNITLEGRSDAEKLRLLMEQLNTYWNNVGIREVRTYFKALSDAMDHLPEWAQNNKDYLEINGFNYKLRIPEDALNDFLREQNELFNVFAFQFKDGQVIASGSRDGISIEVAGTYTVESEPKNHIQFHINSLKFNNIPLPDTTRQELEETFDLSFYPQQVLKFLTAKKVEINDGELVITLAVQF